MIGENASGENKFTFNNNLYILTICNGSVSGTVQNQTNLHMDASDACTYDNYIFCSIHRTFFKNACICASRKIQPSSTVF